MRARIDALGARRWAFAKWMNREFMAGSWATVRDSSLRFYGEGHRRGNVNSRHCAVAFDRLSLSRDFAAAGCSAASSKPVRGT